MNRGVVYIMITAVDGLIKIGRTTVGQLNERMRFLENNGYYNVVGLKRFFAIELEDYSDKEKLLHEIFNKHQVGGSELFALDKDLAKQLLLSFDGKIVFPKKIKKEQEFDRVVKERKNAERLTFGMLGIKIGSQLTFADNDSIMVKTIDETNQIIFDDGTETSLTNAVRLVKREFGTATESESYQGGLFWKYNGKRLTDIRKDIEKGGAK